ncbi:hypothetical protein [Microvirga aerophila]|uniref:Uncharacterized protein n=1 Tax=Microvirga aerophila TaxID=670291 RepID=A0A512BTS0_9HYPH|nr:hypothetical protein [Microvirga aerophila]GEO15334.1 hypothetical protein MAE02_30300 [Microvirga aerophila]
MPATTLPDQATDHRSPTAQDHVPDHLQPNCAERFHKSTPADQTFTGHLGKVDVFYFNFKLRPDGTYTPIGNDTIKDFEFELDKIVVANDKAGHYSVRPSFFSEGGMTFYNLYDETSDTPDIPVASLGSITFVSSTPPPVFDLVV